MSREEGRETIQEEEEEEEKQESEGMIGRSEERIRRPLGPSGCEILAALGCEGCLDFLD